MRYKALKGWRLAVLGCALAAPPALAQETAEAGGDGEDIVATVTMPAADEVIDPATIAMPALAFAPDPKWEKDFDKYYYFNRADTDFATALKDLRECDGLSRGLASPFGNSDVPYPYNSTTSGLVGGAIANVMIAAIVGSAQLRATRRVNMRRCMFFKGYDRFGLPKDMWQTFNFEEGFGGLPEEERQGFLKQQARVASGPRPTTPALGR
ncbi:hypothetical protein L7H23_04475 [Sphingopyxis sp. BSN-002]|uniref:hypothetical protein n=1 Tax=Sphingopyxis sp. BSN-002 TaxID=2911495 RepID=UPI001EDC04F3|nr:hypothetical protein [Sphingopyxis sp. BSN-002]UKK85370.1 hypothetical protein L7H23_04475 [Sphingopyxis sp. BSN-002]